MKRRRNQRERWDPDIGFDHNTVTGMYLDVLERRVTKQASAVVRRALEKTDAPGARDGMVRLGDWCREIERNAPVFKPVEEDDDG